MRFNGRLGLIIAIIAMATMVPTLQGSPNANANDQPEQIQQYVRPLDRALPDKWPHSRFPAQEDLTPSEQAQPDKRPHPEAPQDVRPLKQAVPDKGAHPRW